MRLKNIFFIFFMLVTSFCHALDPMIFNQDITDQLESNEMVYVTSDQIKITDEGMFLLEDNSNEEIPIYGVISGLYGIMAIKTASPSIQPGRCRHPATCLRCGGCTVIGCWNKCSCRYPK